MSERRATYAALIAVTFWLAMLAAAMYAAN